jgi:chromosome segregation ATPase
MSEIEGSDSKIKTYNTEIENVHNKIKDTMKENLEIMNKKDQGVSQLKEMDSQIESAIKKIATFTKLKADLEKQL